METRSTVANLVVSVRPEQWTKNLIVFAALIFAVKLFDPAALALASAAFLIFCALSGVVYLINDVSDREADRQHPLKRMRPIASGALSPGTALAAAVVLGGVALAAAFWLRPVFGWSRRSYVALFVAYSRVLKHVVILDVLTIAIGFVLRAAAGGLVIAVPMSHWLLVCTILLALFLGLAKRRHELTLLADGATGHRRILEEYDPYLLDQMIAWSRRRRWWPTSSTARALRRPRSSAPAAGADHSVPDLRHLPVPVPRASKHGGGSPSEVLLPDRPLLACIALWGLAVIAIIYRPFASSMYT